MNLYFLVVQAVRHHYDGSLQPSFAYITGVYANETEATGACVMLGYKHFPRSENWDNFLYKAVLLQGPCIYEGKYRVSIDVEKL